MPAPTPRRDSLQAFLLSEAYRILCRLHWADWPADPHFTLANDDRFKVRIAIGPADRPLTVATVGPVNIAIPPELAPLEMDILGVMTSQPQTARKLARQAGRKINSKFYEALTSLCRKGLVIRTPDGYKFG